MKTIFYITIAGLLTVLSGCSSGNEGTTGPITIHFDNIVGSADLELNTTDMPYVNAKTETYKVTSLKYYVSNIKLKRSDGKIFVCPVKADGSVGYYLIDETNEASQDVTLENVPAGSYTEVTFSVGVDASLVDQSSQTGALDPAHGLFLDWNAGYTFLALGGISNASTETDHIFQYDVSGYKDDVANGQVNNMKSITLNFGDDAAPVRAQHEPEVHLLFDVNKFLDGTGEQVTFTSSANRHTAIDCETLADNIAAAFVVDHVHAN